jgi:hypothetical protein
VVAVAGLEVSDGGLLSINSETAVILMSSDPVLSVKMYMDSVWNEALPWISP